MPATKYLNPEAPGFYTEVFLCGEKNAPVALGGIKGLASLFATIRDIPTFSKIPPIELDVEKGENILISTVSYASDVSLIF